MKNTSVRKITGVAILLALEIVLQTIGNLIPGEITVNLSLIPIALGAIVYGPVAGAFLGLCNGAMVLAAPDTLSFFWPSTPIGTLVTCLVKCTLAGAISGLVFKLFKGKHLYAGCLISSLLIPIINTGLFLVFCFTILRPAYDANELGQNIATTIFTIPLLINFVIEFGSMLFLTPAILKIYKIMTRTDKHAL